MQDRTTTAKVQQAFLTKFITGQSSNPQIYLQKFHFSVAAEQVSSSAADVCAAGPHCEFFSFDSDTKRLFFLNHVFEFNK